MAAERAKLRRKQEEEERERDKERARRKAAELEEKMKAHSEQKPQTDAQKPTVSEAQVYDSPMSAFYSSHTFLGDCCHRSSCAVHTIRQAD